MKEFLVIWYDMEGSVLHSKFVKSLRWPFAQEDAMRAVIEENPQLWVTILHACTMVQVREVWNER